MSDLFQRRPSVVEARFFSPDIDPYDLASWCGGRVMEDESFYVEVCTAQGQWVMVNVGEWIILERDHPGRAYPCAADVFDRDYEACADAA